MGKPSLKLILIAMATVYQIAASQWNAPLITENVTDGQSVSMLCRDPPKGSLSWFKIKDRHEQIPDDGRRQTDQEGTLYFAYATLADTGLYKCAISTGNNIHLGSPVQLNVKEGETYGKVPVKLLRSSGDTQANLGEDVTLECIFSGRPTPAVSWFYDNRELTNTNNVTISGGSITIKQVSEKHAGIYRCTGNNDDGEENASMNLKVMDPNKVPPSTRGYQETKPTTHTVGKTDMRTAKPNPEMEAAAAGCGTASATGVVAAVTATLWLSEMIQA